MDTKITKSIANNILKWLELSDYEITDLYEESFRAIRKNEYMLSELNVEIFTDETSITPDNVYQYTEYITHVLKRYQ